MTRTFKHTMDCNILINEEKVGELDDILFDDSNWKIRYFVLKNKKNLLKINRILVHTNAIANIEDDKINLKISKEQLMKEPGVGADMPVFREMEKKYFDFYNWPYYWDDMGIFGIDPRAKLDSSLQKQSNLRSCRIVEKYHFKKNEKIIGSIHDIVFNDQDWKIESFLLKSHLFSDLKEFKVNTIELIDWYDRSVHLKQTEFASTSEVKL